MANFHLKITQKNSSRSFDLNELTTLSMGQLEGEKDDRLSADTFFPTEVVQQVLRKTINYVLSPKGLGKSAIFSALQNKYIHPVFFEYDKHSIIPINKAFGNEADYLNPEKFKPKNDRKNYAIYWGLYLMSELILDIIQNHNNKPNYEIFKSKIANIEGFKDQFRLYNILDILDQFNVGFTFNISGQIVEIKPNIKVQQKPRKLLLNDILSTIDEFYRDNNLIALIIIDRIDKFVDKEDILTQKNYIQGLIDCIEEFTFFKNIDPLLFLRTDLFYAFDIKFEYDKVKDRKLELKWEESETLNFIVYRLLSNPYINQNFYGHFGRIFLKEKGFGKEEHKKWYERIYYYIKKYIINPEFKKFKNKNIPFKVASNFIKIFFPFKFEDKDFCEWILLNFKDSNGYINPRLLIYFFNQLFYNQHKKYVLHRKANDTSTVQMKKVTICHFEIFDEDVIESTYNKIRQEELLNIYKLLKSEGHQLLLREIASKTLSTQTFKYGDYNYKRYNVEKEDYEDLLKHLQLLGYCHETTRQIYIIPVLYNCRLVLP